MKDHAVWEKRKEVNRDGLRERRGNVAYYREKRKEKDAAGKDKSDGWRGNSMDGDAVQKEIEENNAGVRRGREKK